MKKFLMGKDMMEPIETIPEELNQLFTRKFGESRTPEIKARLRFLLRARDSTSFQERVLDVGAGDSWYKPFFEHTKYFSTDFTLGDPLTDYSRIDVVSRAEHLPFADEFFHTVLSIGVMEHMCEPEMALKEIRRVLKKGGMAHVFVPFSTACHQIPHDYYRYTCFGLEYLFKKSGFSSWTIEASNGIFWTYLGNLKRLVRLIPSPFIQRICNILTARCLEPLAEKIDSWDQERLFPRFWICYVKK